MAFAGLFPAISIQAAVDLLVWDSISKECTPASGEASVHFSFSVTNMGSAEIVIQSVAPSCGCTVAQMPAQPWRLAAGDHGDLKFTMDLRGKRGALTKTATVNTSVGAKALTMKVVMPGQSNPSIAVAGATPSVTASAVTVVSSERTQNQELARADHQAVFRNDCAKCHAEPIQGKLGKELYAAACGICHEAEHRAAMVPLLGKSPLADNPAYWRTWITFGKPGSLMPGFSKPVGGPLNREQIESLASFLASENATPAHRSSNAPTASRVQAAK
jgi:mono/diheme cytochrome c family protein